MVRAIVGANWGDEGKGKITDMLAEECRHYRQFPGRQQTPVIPLSTIMENLPFILLPSGVFYNHTTSIIGNGVALNIPLPCQMR